MRRRHRVAWRHKAELLTLNCGAGWINRIPKGETMAVFLAKGIHRRCPYLEYEEILYRVALIWETES